MNRRTIASEIKARVESAKTVDYSIWTIGLTHDPDERKEQHSDNGKSVTHWEEWLSDSLEDAQGIESYFINTMSMKGGTGGNLNARKSVYVYIF
jgi:hypothetical protein